MKINKNSLLIALLIGVLLLVVAIPTQETSQENMLGTETEKRLESLLLEMEGVGDVRVMVTFRETDLVEGIVVIAEGGENPVIVQNITEVVQALFDVDSHKIKVIEGNQTN